MDRHCAGRIVASPAAPDWTRRSARTSCGTRFITTALDAGVPLRDVQEAAANAHPRTTMRYDRARLSLDRHATYIRVATIETANGGRAPDLPVRRL